MCRLNLFVVTSFHDPVELFYKLLRRSNFYSTLFPFHPF